MNILKNFILVTHAISLKTTKVALFSCGTPQSQTTAVIIVMVLSTKLTLSLTPSTMRMNVRQQKHHCVGYYQVTLSLKLEKIYN